jgi:hypothetical protein
MFSMISTRNIPQQNASAQIPNRSFTDPNRPDIAYALKAVFVSPPMFSSSESSMKSPMPTIHLANPTDFTLRNST